MNDQQQILSTLREEFDRWEALLAGLSEEQLTAPQLAENWSIKDVLAHLRAWQQRSIARLEAALRDQAPAYPAWPTQFDPEMEGQPHDLNAWLYATYRDQPWSSVHQDWSAGFLRLLELGATIPEKDLLEPGKYSWLEGYALFAVLQGSYEHHDEHAEYLEPVIERLRNPQTGPERGGAHARSRSKGNEMNLVQAIPALPVRNIAHSVAFYTEKLGFTARHQDTGFAIVQRDGIELHLWEASDESWHERAGSMPVVSGAESFIAGTASCRIQVVGVNDLHAELQPRSILHPNAQIADQPWGTREFGVVDTDGNLITFFERV